MDQQQVEMMRKNYASMRDEDLIHIFATRESTLTDEAKFALHEAIRIRKIEHFDGEVSATRDDLTRQHEYEKRKIEKQVQAQRTGRKIIYMFCAILIAAGLLTSILHDGEKGLLLVAAGLVTILVIEVRRMIGRFFVALFRND